jgi:hypothetical protein
MKPTATLPTSRAVFLIAAVLIAAGGAILLERAAAPPVAEAQQPSPAGPGIVTICSQDGRQCVTIELPGPNNPNPRLVSTATVSPAPSPSPQAIIGQTEVIVFVQNFQAAHRTVQLLISVEAFLGLTSVSAGGQCQVPSLGSAGTVACVWTNANPGATETAAVLIGVRERDLFGQTTRPAPGAVPPTPVVIGQTGVVMQLTQFAAAPLDAQIQAFVPSFMGLGFVSQGAQCATPALGFGGGLACTWPNAPNGATEIMEFLIGIRPQDINKGRSTQPGVAEPFARRGQSQNEP